jgi:4'-phosphopantetheinyl transferase
MRHVNVAFPPLRPREIQVWRVDADLPGAEDLLDDAERARARGFRVPGARERFTAAHAGARILLAAAVGTDPRALRFVHRCARCGATDHGKPQLAGGPDGIEFSLSRSGDLALVALALGQPVGIDVERVPVDTTGLDDHVLAATERAALARLSPPDRHAALLRAWTRKEALLKAQGLGVDGDLKRLDVAPAEPGSVQIGRWRVRPLTPRPGYAAAVAAEGDWTATVRTLTAPAPAGSPPRAGTAPRHPPRPGRPAPPPRSSRPSSAWSAGG